MKLNILLIIVAISVGFGFTQFIESPKSKTKSATQVPIETNFKKVIKGQEIPNIQITSINNKTISINDLIGRTVLINFWASWCAPCIVELPDLISLAKENPDIFIVLLSSDLKKEALDRFLKKLSEEDKNLPNIIIAWDQKGKITRDIFQTFQLPETALIDKQGILQQKFVGVIDWKDPKVLKLLR